MMKHNNRNQNPWAGLSSYEDPAKSELKLKFCGRDNETKEVARLIDDNFFVTLYGKSGIGKTSLLNAGVFPALRREQYTPLSLRLGMTGKKSFFQNIITQAIERAIDEVGGIIHIVNVIDEQKEKDATDYLWRWFARRRFLTANGQITFPVLVFDQFEEVFRHNYSRKKTKVLLKQLNYLIDESHAIDDCIVDSEEYNYDFNFRFVLSIREDDLYRLEDILDNCALSALKRCRYRLRSLSKKGARDAILIPGEGLFREDEKKQIAQAVIRIARNKDDKSISTNLLSLVCYRLYIESQKTGGSTISLSLVNSFVKGNLFERFYNEVTRGFSNEERKFIEYNFVDRYGHRKLVLESEYKKHVKEGWERLLKGDSRILQYASSSNDGGKDFVELIHDSFCEPLIEKKKRLLLRKQLLIPSLSSLLSFLVVLVIYFIFKLQYEHIAYNVCQSRLVAEKASDLVDEGDSCLAQLLSLEVLPKDLSHPDRPYTVEAENALRKATMHQPTIIRGHTAPVCSASFSPDGRYIVSASEDSTVRLWNVKTGGNILIIKGHMGEVNSASFNHDGNRIISASSDSTIRIWDVKTGKQEDKQPIVGHTAAVTFVAFSPNDRFFISASEDSTIRIWEANKDMDKMFNKSNWEQVGAPLLGHYNGVNSISISPDGEYIVSTSDDHTIRIWETKTGKQISGTLDHACAVLSASFSHDGKHIVSGCQDGTIRIWDFPPLQELIQSTREHLGKRTLTNEEKRKYYLDTKTIYFNKFDYKR